MGSFCALIDMPAETRLLGDVLTRRPNVSPDHLSTLSEP